MFPIRDTIKSRSFPIINWVIIAANVLVFFYQTSLSGSGIERFIMNWALVPSNVDLADPLTWFPFLTHIWLHGSLFHLISNMWALAIFGDNIEDRMGSGRYLLFYVLGGIAAGVLQFIFTTDPGIPALGASGAIAAVMGAYFLFFPRSRVVTFVPIFFFGWFVNIPAVFYLAIWFLTQFVQGLASLGMVGGMGGVAWWAHIGGFVYGLVLGGPFCIGRCKRDDYPDEYYPW